MPKYVEVLDITNLALTNYIKRPESILNLVENNTLKLPQKI